MAGDYEPARKTQALDDYSATIEMGTVKFLWGLVSFLRPFVFVPHH